MLIYKSQEDVELDCWTVDGFSPPARIIVLKFPVGFFFFLQEFFHNHMLVCYVDVSSCCVRLCVTVVCVFVVVVCTIDGNQC